MHRFIPLVAGVALAILIGAVSAQQAPDWSLVAAPREVYASDQPALTITVAPGPTTSETITLTLPPGLQLQNAQPSTGRYANGVWSFTRPAAGEASLLLTFLVLPTAQRNDDVLVRASWRGAFLPGLFELHIRTDQPPRSRAGAAVYFPSISHSP